MMNINSIRKLEGMIELLLEHASRINEAKPQKYWYPLSMATYGTGEILQALDSLCSFRTTMWEKTAEFEKRFTAAQSCLGSVMVNSGSSANLLVSYLLTDPLTPMVEHGAEALIPVVTWPTQIWSARMAGLKVRLVDVDPNTLNVDLTDLEKSISSRTRVLFLVHLMGNPCDMGRISELAERHGLLLLEDCCEALGSEYDGRKVGNFGLCGSFSFFFSHHISTMEGGMICTNDADVPDRLKMLRAHGWVRNIDAAAYSLAEYNVDPRYAFCNWGFNLRPTELQAGFGLIQLEKLSGFNARRDTLAERFFRFMDEWPVLQRPVVSPRARPSWFGLPLMIHREAPFSRREIAGYLEAKGIETRPIVAGNLARHPVVSAFPEFREREFPGADQVHERGLYIGLSPMSSDQDMERLISIFGDFLSRYQ